jgi:phage host-nuclease inhibitor protein Gam
MTKKNIIKVTTREAAEKAMENLALATHRRDQLTAEMNQKLTEIRERYERELTTCTEIIAANEQGIQAWADANPALFEKARSLKLLHGTIGYRRASAAVKMLRGFTKERVVALVKQSLPAYIRVKEELDKESLLANRQNIATSIITHCGLRIDQADSFFFFF